MIWENSRSTHTHIKGTKKCHFSFDGILKKWTSHHGMEYLFENRGIKQQHRSSYMWLLFFLHMIFDPPHNPTVVNKPEPWIWITTEARDQTIFKKNHRWYHCGGVYDLFSLSENRHTRSHCRRKLTIWGLLSSSLVMSFLSCVRFLFHLGKRQLISSRDSHEPRTSPERDPYGPVNNLWTANWPFTYSWTG